jgi:hypothetical protein
VGIASQQALFGAQAVERLIKCKVYILLFLGIVSVLRIQALDHKAICCIASIGNQRAAFGAIL